MPRPPERSPGVLLSALGDDAVAYDLVTEVVYHLNATAAAVLAHCDGTADVDGITDAVAGDGPVSGEDAAASRATVRDAVEGIIATFVESGLVDRDRPFVTPDPVPGALGPADPAGGAAVATRTIGVLDFAVVLRGPAALVDDVAHRVGLTPAPRADRVVTVDLTTGGDGRVVLDPPALVDGRPVGGRETRRPPSVHDRVGSLLNGFAAATHTCVAVHAGGVRMPDGRIVVLPAASGSGKSTLTAALVTAGCDLLGDEVIGLDLTTGEAIGYPRRISLSSTSRAALGLTAECHDSGAFDDTDPADLRADVQRLVGRVGPVAAIVSPAFVDDAPFTLEKLDVPDGFGRLLRSTFNLARVGQSGLDTLCRVAETTACYRLTHGDVVDAARNLLAPDTLA